MAKDFICNRRTCEFEKVVNYVVVYVGNYVGSYVDINENEIYRKR